MSLEQAPKTFASINGDYSDTPKTLFAKGDEQTQAALILLARKQIERQRSLQGTGPVPATDLKNDSDEIRKAMAALDLKTTSDMSAEEKKALETVTHKSAQSKQDEDFLKSTVASDVIFYAYARRVSEWRLLNS